MKTPSLTTATCLVAAGILVGRLSGLARELVLASQFGMTRDADIAILAITLPDLLNALFIGGAVTAVMIPEIHRLQKSGSELLARQLVCQFMAAMLCVSVAVGIAVCVCDTWFVSLLAPGLDAVSRTDSARLVNSVVFAIPLCTAAAVTSAALQSVHRVAVPAFGTFIFNAVMVGGILVGGWMSSLPVVGGAVVLGAGLRLVTQLIDGWRDGWFRHGWAGFWQFQLLSRGHGVRYGEALIAVGVAVGLSVIGRAFASHVEGGIACYSYVWKLVELPAGVFGALFSMVVFPRLSQSIHERRADVTSRLMQCVAWVTLGVSVVTAAGFILFAAPVTKLLFQHGRVTSDQVNVVIALGRIAFLALPATVLTTIAVGVFHARGDTRSPFIAGVLTVAALLAVLLGGSSERSLSAIVSAVVIVQWCQFFGLIGMLRWRHRIVLFGHVVPRHESPAPETTLTFQDAPAVGTGRRAA